MLKEYQTLIVGVVGFAGVIVTLIVNARLARQHHSREIDHEAKVLRVAVRAELEAIRDAFEERIRTLKNPEGWPSIMVPLDTMTDVYGSLIDKLGLLSEPEIRAVMRAYLAVRQMPERLKLLARSAVTPEEREAGFATVDSRYFAALKQMHENYLREVRNALSVITV